MKVLIIILLVLLNFNIKAQDQTKFKKKKIKKINKKVKLLKDKKKRLKNKLDKILPPLKSQVEYILFFGIDTYTYAKLEGGSVTGEDGKYDSDFDYNNDLLMGFEYRETRKNNWGTNFGIQYHLPRKLQSITIQSESLKEVKSSKISLLRLYLGAIYRWDRFYLPFGINSTSMFFNKPSGSSYKWLIDGGLGFQSGLGFYISKKTSFELGIQTSAYSLLAKDAGNVLNYGNGDLTTTNILVKVAF